MTSIYENSSQQRHAAYCYDIYCAALAVAYASESFTQTTHMPARPWLVPVVLVPP
jgi:hypothetical protein